MSTDPSKIAQAIDPDAGMVNVSCLDLMLIEMVPMAQRISTQLLEPFSTSNSKTTATNTSTTNTVSKAAGKKSAQAASSNTVPPSLVDPEELREATYYRLESVGFRVGMGLVESLSQNAPLPTLLLSQTSTSTSQTPASSTSNPSTTSNTTNLPDPSTYLDLIKFLCKDLWTVAFKKQIDNLKTNHRGTFVLTDNKFEVLRRCSLESGRSEEAKRQAAPFLWYPAGVVRGALFGLGVEEVVVEAEVGGGGVPIAVFTVRIGRAS